VREQLDSDIYFAVIPEWILDAEISSNAVRLYGILRRYADASGSCYPSRATLAARMRCSRDTVDRAARELVDLGALEISARRTSSGDRDSNLYRVVAAPPRGGRKDAATGGGKDAATVGAGMRHRTRANKPEPGEGSPAHAGAVVEAFVDEFRATHQAEPPRQALARIGRDARVMLTEEGRGFEEVRAAGVEAARSGHPNLASALTRVLAGSGMSKRERSLREGLELAQELSGVPSVWELEG
jgi:hypothetical protein